MARERISLISDEAKSEFTLESRIRSGEINPTNFVELTATEQSQVNAVLFKMASEKVNPNQGASALEFILFGFMRVMTKKVNGMSLTEDEVAIDGSLNRIMNLHQVTNDTVAKTEWLFDYMGYAELKAQEILQNRAEHITRKQQITGKA